MTRERSIEPPYGQGRRLQLDDHITVGEPIPHARPLFLVDEGRRSRMARECLSRPLPDNLYLSSMAKYNNITRIRGFRAIKGL